MKQPTPTEQLLDRVLGQVDKWWNEKIMREAQAAFDERESNDRIPPAVRQ
jgi:hypothetical protein